MQPQQNHQSNNDFEQTEFFKIAFIHYITLGTAIFITVDPFLRGDHQYVDWRTANVTNSFDLEPYHHMNAQLGWTVDTPQAYAFANNLWRLGRIS